MNTNDLGDRREAVRELYARTILPFEFASPADSPLRAEARCRVLPGLGLVDLACSNVTTRRTAQHLNDDGLCFGIGVSGRCALRQRGRECVVEAGDALLLDGGEESTNVIKTSSRFMIFGLPRKAIARSVPHLDDKVARPIRRDSEALQLLGGYATVLRDAHALATPAAQRLAVNHVYDLIALALGATRDAAEQATTGGVRAARLQGVLAEIDANFARPGFSPQHVAAKVGLSPRYIQKLLQATGPSFTQRVLELRLQKARAALASGTPRSVVDIALGSGFSDVSYFNRCFRARFGDTPSGLRTQERRAN